MKKSGAAAKPPTKPTATAPKAVPVSKPATRPTAAPPPSKTVTSGAAAVKAAAAAPKSAVSSPKQNVVAAAAVPAVDPAVEQARVKEAELVAAEEAGRMEADRVAAEKAASDAAAAEVKRAELEATTAAAEAAASAAAAERARLANGSITVHYCDYHPVIKIVDGSTTAGAIDEELALTFVYARCEIHLTQAPVKGNDWKTVDWSRLESRNSAGKFEGLVAGKEYWAVVIEDDKEKKRYMAEQAARATAFAKESASRAGGGVKEDRLLSLESCSCIEGNPCVDNNGCKDWSNRFENARRVMEGKRRK